MSLVAHLQIMFVTAKYQLLDICFCICEPCRTVICCLKDVFHLPTHLQHFHWLVIRIVDLGYLYFFHCFLPGSYLQHLSA